MVLNSLRDNFSIHYVTSIEGEYSIGKDVEENGVICDIVSGSARRTRKNHKSLHSS
jgi:hypothetical protein